MADKVKVNSQVVASQRRCAKNVAMEVKQLSSGGKRLQGVAFAYMRNWEAASICATPSNPSACPSVPAHNGDNFVGGVYSRAYEC